MDVDDNATIMKSKTELEVARMELEVEKLRLDVEALRRQRNRSTTAQLVASLLPAISTFLAVGAFAFSLYQQKANEQHWRDDADKADKIRQAEKDRLSEERKLEIRRTAAAPFWEKQLGLYLLASEQAGVLATSDDPTALKKADLIFRELYWGRLPSVEDVGLSRRSRVVEPAMVQFLRALDSKKDRTVLQHLALGLAHSIRDSIQPAFDLTMGVSEPSDAKGK